MEQVVKIYLCMEVLKNVAYLSYELKSNNAEVVENLLEILSFMINLLSCRYLNIELLSHLSVHWLHLMVFVNVSQYNLSIFFKLRINCK